MYGYEIMSELSLSSEELASAKNEFIQIFEKTLVDKEVTVRIAALKAVSAFVSGLEDFETVQTFIPVLPTLLNLVEEALKSDEEKGRQALQSMQELTSAHPEVWKNISSQLMDIVNKVASFKDFEDGTRACAIELGLALAEEMPSALRKSQDATKSFLMTLFEMLKEVEEDEATWAETVEDPDKLSTDSVSTASQAIVRLAKNVGEKTIVTICQPIIMENVNQDIWTNKFAAYTLFGLITETCSDSYYENLTSAVQTASKGVKDNDVRVRYASLGALSAQMTFLAPAVQIEFHTELVPVIAQHMANEPLIKM